MKKDCTHISYILDRSGSMSSIKEPTIKGFNEFIESQRKLPGNATISLVLFDDVIETPYNFVPLSTFPLLNDTTFQPRGWTALLDALGTTINSLGQKLAGLPENERPERIIVVCQTDGEENRSKEFSKERIKEMITHQKDKYNWQFVFLGANQDAILTATSYGIDLGRAITYQANSVGVDYVYSGVNCLTSSLRSCNVSDMSSFTFTDEDRKKQENLV